MALAFLVDVCRVFPEVPLHLLTVGASSLSSSFLALDSVAHPEPCVIGTISILSLQEAKQSKGDPSPGKRDVHRGECLFLQALVLNPHFFFFITSFPLERKKKKKKIQDPPALAAVLSKKRYSTDASF